MSSLAPNMKLSSELSLVRLLGQGSMGEVWVANMAGREVAVKFMAAELEKDPVNLERFKREWNVACTIQSPHIVEMIGAGQTAAGQHYIIMELLDGDDLETVVEGMVGGMSPTATITLLEQVASALDVAHAKGIVHRDIKPENIYLCKSDDGLVVKILDFGLAKSWTGNMNITATGVLVGTPYYMSPEQLLEGGRDLDHRADLWAFGALAYRLLLGAQPFDADNLTDLIISITDGRYHPVSQAGGPAALVPFFDKAFQVERTLRFNSANEMVVVLAQALGVPTRGRASERGTAKTEVMPMMSTSYEEPSLNHTMLLDEDARTPLIGAAVTANESTVTGSSASGYPSHFTSSPPVPPVVSTTATTVPPAPRAPTASRPPSRGGPIAAMVVMAVVLAGVVVGWFVWSGDGATPTAKTPPSAKTSATNKPPPAKADRKNEAPKPARPTPVPKVEPTASPTAAPSATPSATPSAAPSASPDGSAPSPDGKSYLEVVCDPACMVLVDEVKRGNALPGKPLRTMVPAGKRILTLVTNSGTKKSTVEVAKGTVKTVRSP